MTIEESQTSNQQESSENQGNVEDKITSSLISRNLQIIPLMTRGLDSSLVTNKKLYKDFISHVFPLDAPQLLPVSAEESDGNGGIGVPHIGRSILSPFKRHSKGVKVKFFAFQVLRAKADLQANISEFKRGAKPSFYFRSAANDLEGTSKSKYIFRALLNIANDICIAQENFRRSHIDYQGSTIENASIVPNPAKCGFPNGVSDITDDTFCFSSQPNDYPVKHLIDILINILSCGGELCEIDAYVSEFRNATHSIFALNGPEATDEEISKYMSSLLRAHLKGGGSIDNVLFIPGQETYMIKEPLPPAYSRV